VKLARNAFGDKDTVLESDNNLIHFNSVELLHILQEKEGCCKAYTLR